MGSTGIRLVIALITALALVGAAPEAALAKEKADKADKEDKKAKGPPGGCKIEPGTFCVYGNLVKANLKGANLKGGNFANANFSGAYLTGVNLANADLTNADFTGATLINADLSGAKIAGAKFDRTQLMGTIWTDKVKCATSSVGKCDKPLHVTIKGCKIEPKTVCNEADLAGQNLRTADLSGAKLVKANLQRANLSYSNLEGADLTGADLRNANLKNAAIKGAIIKDTNFSGADAWDGNFKCPEGSIGRCLNPNAKAGHK